MISSLNAVITVLLVCVYKMSLSTSSKAEVINHEYCVVGAGPGGLQIGFYLERAGRDYVIFERDGLAGAFYVKYPRHRKLISINKRHTGKTNKEFNMRHDWNSLLSDDESLLMTRYSKKFFPDADDLVRYLNDYATKLKLQVQYNTNIKLVSRNGEGDDALFHLTDQNGTMYTCKNVIMSTGISTENLPRNFIGVEYTESYSEMSVNPDDYEGQTVLIIGRGNSAFETAENIMGATNLIHMFARSRVRLSWETHYVGDLRAVNNGILDTYQLKSLDALLVSFENETATTGNSGSLFYSHYTGSFMKTTTQGIALSTSVDFNNQYQTLRQPSCQSVTARIWPQECMRTTKIGPDRRLHVIGTTDNFAVREPYDRIIRCLGFKFDFSVFDNSTQQRPCKGKRSRKYPEIQPNYESTTVPRLFFAGTNTHSIDLRKSAGGFIHGFRYTARALFRLLEWRNHEVTWPHITVPVTELLNVIVKRINEASGIYQMFGVLGEIMVFRENGKVEYFEDFPIRLVHKFE
ncbi:unnamed protein product, partial [Porites evermanni]